MTAETTKNIVKIDDEILENLKKIQRGFYQATQYFGELHYQKNTLENEISKIEGEFRSMEEARSELLNKIQQQYGAGALNLETGEYEVE